MARDAEVRLEERPLAYWLVKSEPACWSWQQHMEVGTAPWDGVRNHEAARNLRAMQTGDYAFFYHSGRERRIMGVIEVSRPHYPDPSDPSGRFGMVDFKALYPFVRPVTLAEIKADERLSHIALVRQPRLSVMPIDPVAWRLICGAGS
jgi:predicted RNA-binding protein with PUA-like domain